jgi:sporulation and spore germination protein
MRRLLLFGVVLVVLALLARAWFQRSSEDGVVVAPGDSTVAPIRATSLWFASPDGDSLTGETRDLAEESDLHTRVAALVAALEEGPRLGGMRVLPEGTRLLHVYLDDGGLLTLDLSLPFRQGFRGGPRAEELVLGSLVRTLAANMPEVRSIRIVCGGAALPTLGGHFPLDQPLDPDEWP